MQSVVLVSSCAAQLPCRTGSDPNPIFAAFILSFFSYLLHVRCVSMDSKRRPLNLAAGTGA